MQANKQPRILIVDDEPHILYTLEMLLSPEDYEISMALNGAQAFSLIEVEPPDTILLDVMMPDITGYEVCRRLKGDPRWQHIPIVLVTALDRKEDIIEGLDSGADEFLSKPVNGSELRARVRSMLRIKRHYDELEGALKLQEEMANLIVHDLRNPLTSILMSSEVWLRTGGARSSTEKSMNRIYKQAERLNHLIDDLLILARMKSGRLELQREPWDLGSMLMETAGDYEEIAELRGIKIVADMNGAAVERELDAGLMGRVFDNLVNNAVKFSPKGGQITLRLQAVETNGPSGRPRSTCVQIMDEGPGIPVEHRERIFNQYEIIKSVKSDIPQIGLGLALCKKVVEAHDGEIYVENNRPTGAIFTIRL